MPSLMEPPPYSPIEAVTETLHGVSVTDPYRWLEDQESPRTREWLAAQTRYARAYLDSIPRRERIQNRIRELLDVETYDSLQKVGIRYFFRKRLPGQERGIVGAARPPVAALAAGRYGHLCGGIGLRIHSDCLPTQNRYYV